MEIRKSEFRTHEEFGIEVFSHNAEIGDWLINGSPTEYDAWCRVYAPNGVVFDCHIQEIMELADLEIMDIVVTDEDDVDEPVIIFEYGSR